MKKLWEEAVALIKTVIDEHGIYASTSALDNYKRIWSRDAAMVGIAGILIKDKDIINALKNSIYSLANHQSENGQIPSNIKFVNGRVESVSYGTLSAKVDSTTWWLIALSIYIKNSNDIDFKKLMRPKLEKAIEYLRNMDINKKNLLYIPLAGNWADEYPVQGYTLYDNALYFWALNNLGVIYDHTEWHSKSQIISDTIIHNFNAHQNDHDLIYSAPYKDAKMDLFMPSYIMPNKYYDFWDLPANAFAILLNLNKRPEKLVEYLGS